MMTEHTAEFLAQFPKSYGLPYRAVKSNYDRCAKAVYSDGWGGHQCARKNGHGPHGAWCKIHDPVAVKAKREAANAKLNAEWAALQRDTEFTRACRAAIREIAAGHNDPRGLAQGIIDKMEGRE